MLDWLKLESFILPNWAWIAIFAGVAVVLITVIIIACKKGDKQKNGESRNEPVLMLNDAEQSKMLAEQPEKTEQADAEPAPSTEPEPVLVGEEPVKEKKTAAKKTASAKKAGADKKVAEKEEPKVSAKSTAAKAKNEETKTAAKPAEKKEEPKTAAKSSTAKTTAGKAVAKSDDEVKIYHISKRTDKKWEVRLDGGEKALKLFFTQKEAIDYARKTSGKKRIIVHKEDGGTREV